MIVVSMAESNHFDRSEFLILAQFLDLIRTALTPWVQHKNPVAVIRLDDVSVTGNPHALGNFGPGFIARAGGLFFGNEKIVIGRIPNSFLCVSFVTLHEGSFLDSRCSIIQRFYRVLVDDVAMTGAEHGWLEFCHFSERKGRGFQTNIGPVVPISCEWCPYFTFHRKCIAAEEKTWSVVLSLRFAEIGEVVA